MGLRPAWIQTSLRIAMSFFTCFRVCRAGLDPCWSQTNYVGFGVTRLICFLLVKCVAIKDSTLLQLKLLTTFSRGLVFICLGRQSKQIMVAKFQTLMLLIANAESSPLF
jgi:hypothetical protein